MTNAEKFKEVFGPRWVDWEAEYKGTPTIPLSVIEDIKAEIENMAFYKCDSVRLLPKDYVLEVIDRKIKEIKHE